jgi:hypothetical protein
MLGLEPSIYCFISPINKKIVIIYRQNQSIAQRKVLTFDKFCDCAPTQQNIMKKSKEKVWPLSKISLPLHSLS